VQHREDRAQGAVKTLIIGGSRSGKSALAAKWAAQRSNAVCVIVTGVASDPEMAARIEAHRRERPAGWRVREAPVGLGSVLEAESTSGALVLVDCLTVWTANCLWQGPPDYRCDLEGWRSEREALLMALRTSPAEVIVVSNEVGTGIVPDNIAARAFRDEHGWLNQAVAAVCDKVFLVTAGLPLRLKPAMS
jgi:adenosylcobinamide kinase / adenosylcobinamide-phosphate guanylyltransferase